MPGWVLRIGCAAAAGILPLVAGAPAAIILLLLMPVAVECCREGDERLACAGAIAALWLACWLTLPQAVSGLALPWCIAGGVMLLVKDGHSVKRGLAWVGICLAMLCMLSMILGHRYQGDLCNGLAGEMVNAITQRKDGNQLLLRCYQAGLCRLEDDLAAAVHLLGPLAMVKSVVREMANSLRTTLADSLMVLLPQAIVAWLLLTAVLTAAVPDMVRRKMGKQGYLPPFAQWHLTPQLLGHLNVMVVLYLLTLFATSSFMVLLGRLCGAAFQYSYMLLGLAVMEGMTKRHGMARITRRIWMAAVVLFAPFVLLILGIVDYRLDLRLLRRSTDDKGGFER